MTNNKNFIVNISTVPKNVELKIGLIEQTIHEYIENHDYIINEELNECLSDVLPNNTYIIHDDGTVIGDIDGYTIRNFHIVEKADTEHKLDTSEINYMLPKDTKFSNIGCNYMGTSTKEITIPKEYIASTDDGNKIIRLCNTVLPGMQYPVLNECYKHDVKLLFLVNCITVKTEDGKIKEFTGSDISQTIDRIDSVQCSKYVAHYDSSDNSDVSLRITLDILEKTLQIKTNYIDKFRYQQIESVTLTLIVDDKGDQNEEFICYNIINTAAQKILASLSGKQMLSYVTGVSSDVIEKRIREYIRERNIVIECSGDHVDEALSKLGIIKKTFRD